MALAMPSEAVLPIGVVASPSSSRRAAKSTLPSATASGKRRPTAGSSYPSTGESGAILRPQFGARAHMASTVAQHRQPVAPVEEPAAVPAVPSPSPFASGPRLAWYRSPIDSDVLAELMRRNNLRAWTQTLCHLGLFFATGAAAYFVFANIDGGNWPWTVPLLVVALFVHGTIGPFMGLIAVHELQHHTVFTSRALNGFFEKVYAFISWSDYTSGRWHDTDECGRSGCERGASGVPSTANRARRKCGSHPDTFASCCRRSSSRRLLRARGCRAGWTVFATALMDTASGCARVRAPARGAGRSEGVEPWPLRRQQARP